MQTATYSTQLSALLIRCLPNSPSDYCARLAAANKQRGLLVPRPDYRALATPDDYAVADADSPGDASSASAAAAPATAEAWKEQLAWLTAEGLFQGAAVVNHAGIVAVSDGFALSASEAIELGRTRPKVAEDWRSVHGRSFLVAGAKYIGRASCVGLSHSLVSSPRTSVSNVEAMMARTQSSRHDVFVCMLPDIVVVAVLQRTTNPTVSNPDEPSSLQDGEGERIDRCETQLLAILHFASRVGDGV